MRTITARRVGFSPMQALPTNCGPMTDPVTDAHEFTEDTFLGGQLGLGQARSGHGGGDDAMVVAAARPARSGDRVVEFGAGVGAAGLAVAKRAGGIKLVLVEIDETLAALARGNAASNAIRADVVVLDVTAAADAFAAAGLVPDSCDVVLMNPPFNDPARHRASPDKAREIAHVATSATLENWIHASRRILKSGGVLTLICRPHGLAAALASLDRGVGSLAILPRPDDARKLALR